MKCYRNFELILKQAGPNGGDIIMIPQGNGTVYIGQTDMLKLFEVCTRKFKLKILWKYQHSITCNTVNSDTILSKDFYYIDLDCQQSSTGLE